MITTAVDDRVATLTLSRPGKRNAISADMGHQISRTLDQWDQDETIRAVVLIGEGAGFCAGLDRDELQSDSEQVRDAIYQSSRSLHRAVGGFGKPIIAAVHGFAFGSGFDLAVMCDMRVVAHGSSLGHPEARMGGVAICTPLRRVVGDSWARRLCYDGTPIDAETATRIGWAIDAVDPGDLAERADSAARAIAETPVAALRKAKALFTAEPPLEEWIVAEHDDVFEQGHTIHSAVTSS